MLRVRSLGPRRESAEQFCTLRYALPSFLFSSLFFSFLCCTVAPTSATSSLLGRAPLSKPGVDSILEHRSSLSRYLLEPCSTTARDYSASRCSSCLEFLWSVPVRNVGARSFFFGQRPKRESLGREIRCGVAFFKLRIIEGRSRPGFLLYGD